MLDVLIIARNMKQIFLLTTGLFGFSNNVGFKVSNSRVYSMEDFFLFFLCL